MDYLLEYSAQSFDTTYNSYNEVSLFLASWIIQINRQKSTTSGYLCLKNAIGGVVMGGSFAKLDSPVHIAMLGLDSAGKTTVLYRLKFDQYVNTVPTVGFNCEKVKGTMGKAKGVCFVIWDVGGQDKVRPLWRTYTRSTDGVVFVVDSADAERMEEAKVELLRIVRTPEAAGVPVLVIANKQDLPSAKDAATVEKELSLHELVGHLTCSLPACAVTGEGLDVALEQLYQMIQKRRKSLKQAKKKR